MVSEDVLAWAETAVGLLFDANYSEREALFIQNTIERLAAEVRELRARVESEASHRLSLCADNERFVAEVRALRARTAKRERQIVWCVRKCAEWFDESLITWQTGEERLGEAEFDGTDAGLLAAVDEATGER